MEDDSTTTPAEGQPPPPAPAETWTNPSPAGRYDLVVIGGGRAAVEAVLAAATPGRRVALANPQLPGASPKPCVRAAEDALAEAARRAAAGREVDFSEIMRWVAEASGRLAEGPSAADLAASGIDVFQGQPAFIARDKLTVDGRRFRFRRCVLAVEPPKEPAELEGHEEAGCLRPGDLTKLAALPRRLAIVGTGARECCWAQTFCRLGSEVYLLGRDDRLLLGEHPDAAHLVAERLRREGVRLQLGSARPAVERTGDQRAVTIEREGRREKLFVDEVLLDDARGTDLEPLALDAAGVEWNAEGVKTDDRFRTANRRIAVASPGSVGRDSRAVVVRSVRTDPAVIALGRTPEMMAARGWAVDTYRAELAGTRRAVLAGRDDGFVELYVRRTTGRAVGACVVAPWAEELAAPLALPIAQGLRPAALAEFATLPGDGLEVLGKLAEQCAAGPPPSLRAWLSETWHARPGSGLQNSVLPR